MSSFARVVIAFAILIGAAVTGVVIKPTGEQQQQQVQAPEQAGLGSSTPGKYCTWHYNWFGNNYSDCDDGEYCQFNCHGTGTACSWGHCVVKNPTTTSTTTSPKCVVQQEGRVAPGGMCVYLMQGGQRINHCFCPQTIGNHATEDMNKCIANCKAPWQCDSPSPSLAAAGHSLGAVAGAGQGSVATSSGSVDPCSAPPAQVTAVVINPTGDQQAQEPEQGLGSAAGISGHFHFYPASAGDTTIQLHRYGTSWLTTDLAVGKKLFIESVSGAVATESNAVRDLVIHHDNTSTLTLAQPLKSAFSDGQLQSYD